MYIFRKIISCCNVFFKRINTLFSDVTIVFKLINIKKYTSKVIFINLIKLRKKNLVDKYARCTAWYRAQAHDTIYVTFLRLCVTFQILVNFLIFLV